MTITLTSPSALIIAALYAGLLPSSEVSLDSCGMDPDDPAALPTVRIIPRTAGVHAAIDRIQSAPKASSALRAALSA